MFIYIGNRATYSAPPIPPRKPYRMGVTIATQLLVSTIGPYTLSIQLFTINICFVIGYYILFVYILGWVIILFLKTIFYVGAGCITGVGIVGHSGCLIYILYIYICCSFCSFSLFHFLVRVLNYSNNFHNLFFFIKVQIYLLFT